jgi:hypothetical protein
LLGLSTADGLHDQIALRVVVGVADHRQGALIMQLFDPREVRDRRAPQRPVGELGVAPGRTAVAGGLGSHAA